MSIRTQVVCDGCGVSVDIAAHALGLPAQWVREEIKRVQYGSKTDEHITTHDMKHYCSKCALKHLGKRG